MNIKRKLPCAEYTWTKQIWPFVMPVGQFDLIITRLRDF